MMKKFLFALFVLWAGVAFVAPAWLAPMVQQQLQQATDAPFPVRAGITWQLVDYQRGYFSSTAQLRLQWAGKSFPVALEIVHSPLLWGGVDALRVSARAERDWLAEGKIRFWGQIVEQVTHQQARLRWQSALWHAATGNLSATTWEIPTANGVWRIESWQATVNRAEKVLQNPSFAGSLTTPAGEVFPFTGQDLHLQVQGEKIIVQLAQLSAQLWGKKQGLTALTGEIFPFQQAATATLTPQLSFPLQAFGGALVQVDWQKQHLRVMSGDNWQWQVDLAGRGEGIFAPQFVQENGALLWLAQYQLGRLPRDANGRYRLAFWWDKRGLSANGKFFAR